jgi:hypothetical protein
LISVFDTVILAQVLPSIPALQGIDIQQLIRFCQWQQYPQSFLEFLLANKFQLDHLKYDVGVDYCWEKGHLNCLKSGIYGAF